MRRQFAMFFALLMLAFACVRPEDGLRAQEAKKEGPPEPTVKVGDMAPDFELTDQTGKKVALHDYRGKKQVVLAFYIFAFTGG